MKDHRYQDIKVSDVLSWVNTETESLTLKELSKKRAMLLALSNASRSLDLQSLDLKIRS